MTSRARLRFLFPLVPLVFVIAAVELGAAAYRSVRCPGVAPTFAVPDNRFGWIHPADTSVDAFACAGPMYEWFQHTHFNSSGLNDDEHALPRSPGSARVLVLGDSVTEALQVVRNDNFSKRLEASLGGQVTGRRVEVINSGHSGFGTDNEVLYYEAEGWRYQADVVLLVFNLQNDFAENSPRLLDRMYAGGFVHPKAGISFDAKGGIRLDTAPYEAARQEWAGDPWRSSPALVWLRTRSFLVRHLSNLLRGDSMPVMPPVPATYPAELDVYAARPDGDWLEARHITGALLERLRADVESHGSRLLVAVVPSRETVAPAAWGSLVAWFPKLAGGNWDLELPRRDITALLAARGIASVDTTDVLRRPGAEAPLYFAFDPHPTAAGHARIAEAIDPELGRMLDGYDRSGRRRVRQSTSSAALHVASEIPSPTTKDTGR